MKINPQRPTLVIIFTALLSINLANADSLTMKDGQVIKGKFIARDAQNITFEIGGQKIQFPTSNVASVTMDMQTNITASAPPKSAVPAEKPAAVTNITVPEGTRIMARIDETLDSSRHEQGHKFTAHLEADLAVNGTVVAPKGATMHGLLTSSKSSGHVAGSSEMELIVTDIMINNQLHSLSTSPLAAVTENTAGNTARRTARGAAIGGLIGGSDDARRGAKIGLGLSILSRGNQIHIPQGTLMEFHLSAPFTP